MVLSVLSFNAYSLAYDDLPAGCEYGRDKKFEPDSEVDLVEQMNNARNVYNDSEDYQSWASILNFVKNMVTGFDYLRIEGDQFLLKGQGSRFKGNLFDPLAYVRFYTSESGYVGKDKSNLEANAYKEITFTKTYGRGLVWIIRGGLCSAKSVIVQKKPEAGSVNAEYSAYSPGLINVKLKSSGSKIDKFSEFGMSKQSPIYTWVLSRTHTVAYDKSAGGYYCKKIEDTSDSYLKRTVITTSIPQVTTTVDNCNFDAVMTINDGHYTDSSSISYFGGLREFSGGGSCKPGKPCGGLELE